MQGRLIEVDSVPAARLFVAGRLEAGGQVRELPEQRVEDVTLAASIPPRVPRHIELRAGVSTRPGVDVGATEGDA